MSLTQKLLYPSTLVLLAANAIPLLGVLLWHWDAFLLLMLYWMETAVIGFWTIATIAASPEEALGDTAKNQSRGFLVGFFTVHAGLFMGAHFAILWSEFSGEWAGKVHNVVDFVRVIVIATGLWLPLIALFISRGFSFLLRRARPQALPESLAFLFRSQPEKNKVDDGEKSKEGGVLFAFYARIITMQVALIFGGFLAQHLGAIAPAILLIAIKVAIDLFFQFKIDLADDGKAKAVVVTTT